MRISDWSSDVCSSDLIQQDQNLEQLITLQKNGVALGAVDYIGKEIEASGRTTMLQDGAAKFAYLLPEEAKAASLRIFDSSGSLVFHESVDTAEGVHDFAWDGHADNGELLPDGEYSFERSEEHTSELQSLMRISYAVFCLKKK